LPGERQIEYSSEGVRKSGCPWLFLIATAYAAPGTLRKRFPNSTSSVHFPAIFVVVEARPDWHIPLASMPAPGNRREIRTNQFALAFLATFSPSVAWADDAESANAKLREYFATFNNTDIHTGTMEINSTALHTGYGSDHVASATAAKAFEYRDSFRRQITGPGWLEFRIEGVKTCSISDTLALLDIRYSRRYR
jgi:hypothetical protein